MRNQRRTAVFRDCLKKNRTAFLIFLGVNLTNFAVFSFYRIPPEPFWYSLAVSFFLLVLLLTVDFIRESRAAKERERALSGILTDRSCLSDRDLLIDRDYGAMIDALRAECGRLTEEYTSGRKDAEDYYTAWVHQIKTPIAVMKLRLTEDTEENRALTAELFRIEQYADMVLSYLRLGSEANDLVIRAYPLDDLIRESIRKYASLFILRKLKLDFEPTERSVVTDKKWFTFILEQLLSNAVKYTPDGEVRIRAEGDRLLVSDTGIGIAAEDLPRIFEKGYTGENGRIGQKSSGLGLYLVKKASALLSLSVTCESCVGQGTTFTILLPRQ